VASWGWPLASWHRLQSPFFIVCLNQGHYFLSFFPINFYDFFELFSSEYHGGRLITIAKKKIIQAAYQLKDTEHEIKKNNIQYFERFFHDKSNTIFKNLI
jgi:hypothetical protein